MVLKLKYGIAALLLSISADITAQPITDLQLSQSLVGSWTVSKADTYYGQEGHVSTYRKDGTLQHIQYTSGKCDSIDSITHGSWLIKDGQLMLTVTESNGKNPFPIGIVVTDKIVTIDDNSFVFLSSEGRKVRRTRSDKCL
ncbi:hypothetical protein L1285_16085 [Pseudoalteromonas sp. DL2-H2.2]|uniref:hypothetical protein n=1 Tax=Pseudoalteromonas sp. DL2-H2.2 TaxID=2908889 RepID=UPI001F1FB06B|nr:hypothetical protein [Pseudoalteromonas sp. DL2-H2.2]MCF2909845.1 hypothetical protein [Pseudoalteromonas sp. DL2-H2.2]